MKKVMFIPATLTLAMLLFFGSALAQNGKTMTLDECINVALKNNSQLKTTTYQLDRSGSNVKASYSTILPRVTTTFSSGRFIQGDRTVVTDVPVGFDSTRGQAIFEQTEITQDGSSRNSHFARISYSQTLFNFGRNWNTINQAKASFDASSHRLATARQNVHAEVRRRYFELLKAVNLEREYREAVERSQEQLNRTKSMYEIGSVAQVDVYRSEVTLGNDQINLLTQKNIVQIARGNLNVAMGRDPETPIDVAEVEVEFFPEDYTLEQAIEIAEENNPELKRFEDEMQSAEYGMKVAKAAYWPSIGVNVSYTRNNTDFSRVYGELDKNFNISLGAQIDFNIFNGLSDAAEVGRQSANYSIARENWTNTKRQLHLDVKQAFLNLEAFKEISDINERNLRAAEEEYRLAQERYRVGAGTQLEVTEAQVSLTRARVTLVRAKYDAMIAQAQLEAAMGTIAQQTQ
ncbi:TolC family protein [candidate division KSB1 bacterium]|nr:TolC family protein [candidate division KSB1 bacterium]NIR69520.1 TolC family protein [candidate division KSB1 bacterium]NIS24288.1 TolC family protein [candidate division KSB1 bacterium]NIT71203.1 TolC family protein [candidate division KSB1 bacterium]NIU24907.1 TolC family protein [candidate division KSB1 bacterium]